MRKPDFIHVPPFRERKLIYAVACDGGKRIKLSFLKTRGSGTRAHYFFSPFSPLPGSLIARNKGWARGGGERPVSLVGQSN